MCDFSAKAAKHRKAVVEDKLITRSISKHTNGFTGVEDSTVAVCLLPGTELAFDKNVRANIAPVYGPRNIREYPHRVAIFRQVEKENERTHHDALEFPDGQCVKLNALIEEQTATVLQLPAEPKTPAEAEAQRRAEYV